MEILSIAFFTAFLSSAVRMAVPIAFGGLGEVFLQKSGVLNIGLEGVMLGGAFCAYAGGVLLGSAWAGLLCGILGGIAVASLHGLLSVRLMQNQSVSGIAINLFIVGLTSYLFKIFTANGLAQIEIMPTIRIPLLADIPIIGEAFFNKDILAYICYILVIVLTVFYKKTRTGMNFAAVGESSRVCDSAGLDVLAYRYKAILVNGILGGVGGAYLVVTQLGVFNDNMIAGRGYIALATVILGRFTSIGVFASSLLFGAAMAMQIRLQAVGIEIPSQVFAMAPYILTLIALLLTAGKNQEPAALAKPFRREER